MTIKKQVELWEATAETHRDAMRQKLTTRNGSRDERLARAAARVANALKAYAIELPA